MKILLVFFKAVFGLNVFAGPLLAGTRIRTVLCYRPTGDFVVITNEVLSSSGSRLSNRLVEAVASDDSEIDVELSYRFSGSDEEFFCHFLACIFSVMS